MFLDAVVFGMCTEILLAGDAAVVFEDVVLSSRGGGVPSSPWSSFGLNVTFCPNGQDAFGGVPSSPWSSSGLTVTLPAKGQAAGGNPSSP